MNIEEEIDWILVDGGNGLDVLWFLILHSPFMQGLIGVGLAIALLCVYFDKDDEIAKYIKDCTWWKL
jgi:hypothetical protein|tara:strand:- start:260 stop:460 length:201 start_codon:yes stop_codon:yes gene_type:complete